MDCLRSFTIAIRNAGTYNAPLTTIKQWGTVGTQHWAMQTIASSNYAIQGFKNIDIYGASVNGTVIADVSNALNGVIVDDWGFGVFFDSQLPLVGGVATSSFWTLNDNNASAKQFCLSRYTNEVKFASPLKSVRNIFFNDLKAQGQSSQTVGNISLIIDLNFMFYYKFEGE